MLKIRGTNKRGIRKKRRNETKKTKGGEVKKGKDNIYICNCTGKDGLMLLFYCTLQQKRIRGAR